MYMLFHLCILLLYILFQHWYAVTKTTTTFCTNNVFWCYFLFGDTIKVCVSVYTTNTMSNVFHCEWICLGCCLHPGLIFKTKYKQGSWLKLQCYKATTAIYCLGHCYFHGVYKVWLRQMCLILQVPTAQVGM